MTNSPLDLADNQGKNKTNHVPFREQNIQLYPYGLVQGLSQIKPIFLLSNKKESEYLPVWVDLFESESLSHYFQTDSFKHHPYQTHVKIFEELGWRIDHLLFYKMEGYRLYGQLVLKKDGEEKVFSERAEDIILLALYSKAKIFCKQFILEEAKQIADLKHLQGLDTSLEDYKIEHKYLN